MVPSSSPNLKLPFPLPLRESDTPLLTLQEAHTLLLYLEGFEDSNTIELFVGGVWGGLASVAIS